MAAAAHYLFSQAIDPATGDWLAGTDRPGGQPATQVVLFVLRTPLGAFAPDPTIGLDYAKARKALPNAVAIWRAEVERALAPVVRDGVITKLVVTVDSPRRDSMFYDVTFTDPRTAERLTLRRLEA